MTTSKAALASIVGTCVAQGQSNHLTLNALGVVLLQNVSSLMFVLGSEGDMDATVAVILLRVGVNDGAQCGGFEWWQWRHWILNNLLLLLLFGLLVVVVVQRGNWRLQMQLVVLILLVVHIEDMHLLLLLFLLLGHGGLHWLLGKCLIRILDDDLNDGLRCLQILRIWRISSAKAARILSCNSSRISQKSSKCILLGSLTYSLLTVVVSRLWIIVIHVAGTSAGHLRIQITRISKVVERPFASILAGHRFQGLRLTCCCCC